VVDVERKRKGDVRLSRETKGTSPGSSKLFVDAGEVRKDVKEVNGSSGSDIQRSRPASFPLGKKGEWLGLQEQDRTLER
jgi:hypothetical protein